MAKGILLSLFLVLFTAISLFGVGLSMTAHSGEMASCPLMGGWASMCQMDILGHIAYWQQLFIAKVNDASTLILSLLSIFFLLAVYQLGIRDNTRTPLDLSFYLYNKSNPQVHLSNYLNHAFSKGILHPKIY